jgi:hypothetical protein
MTAFRDAGSERHGTVNKHTNHTVIGDRIEQDSPKGNSLPLICPAWFCPDFVQMHKFLIQKEQEVGLVLIG